MVTCPNCGAENPQGSTFCQQCGARLSGSAPQQPKPKPSMTYTPRGWMVFALIFMITGIILSIIGFWVIGIPLIVAAGVYGGYQGDTYSPRISMLIVAVMINWITIIPNNETISIFGFAIAWMGIILTLPDAKEGQAKRKRASVIVGGVGAVLTTFWTIFVLTYIGADFGSVTLPVLVITVPLVIASIIWKQPVSGTVKVIGTSLLFLPLIIMVIRFLFIAGGFYFGNLIDQVQNLLSGTQAGISGTILDTILNPTAAIQAGLRPATTQDVSSATSGPPSVAFTVSGETVPTSGCYDSSSFQVIARVRNTGDVFINDLELKVSRKDAPGTVFNPCNEWLFSNEGEDVSSVQWSITSLPKTVSSTRNTLIDSVPAGTEFEGVAPSHTCFINVFSETGYHSFTRLPIQFIESEYGRSKAEQNQLDLSVIPSTISSGPVELSLGGFEQPILYYGETTNQVTMITAISDRGNGEVTSYESAYIYIPNNLLDNGQCIGDNDDWECLSGIETSDGYSVNCNNLNDGEAQDYCNAFLKFKNDNEIGSYSQFSYDNSDVLLGDGYSICFYKPSLDDVSLISTGTCTLSVGDVMSINDLRRTLLIRGDVLYTYKVSGETSITLQDCDI